METYATLQTFYAIAVKVALAALIFNVAFCVFYGRRFNVPFKRLSLFLILNLLTEILAYTFIQLEINNLPLLHMYTLGEFVLLSYFYQSLFKKSSRFRKFLNYYIVIGALFILSNSLWIQSIYGFNTIAKTFVQISIIGYAVFFFYRQLGDRPYPEAISKSLSLVNSAVIIYYSGSLFIFMYGKFSLVHVEGYVVFWAFNAVLNFIFQLLILIGLWKAFFRKKTLSL
ncbi:MAG: hypothetical protein AAF466_04520 [Bacteroidota bacterium]